MRRKIKLEFLLITVLFVLSGLAGLIYQVVWFKHLSYFLGNTTYSQVIVLATFMGGLAIGSWWWGKKADHSKDALKLFAWLEVSIALYCFLYFPIFELAKEGFITFVKTQGWSSDSSIVLLLKLFVSALTMLIPTILMGGTLPVLVRYLSDRITEVGKNISILYFINSLGAVLGTVIAGFYLLQTIGLKATVYVGATADLLVGLVFLIITYDFFKKRKKIFSENKNLKSSKVNTQTEEKYVITPKQYNIVICIAGISGMCAMIYEVVWLRLLIPVLSSTTYSFTLILAVFITGITLGSLLVYFILPKLRRPFLFLGLCQLFLVLSIALTLPFYEKIPYLIWSVNDTSKIEGQTLSYSWYLFTQFFYTSLVMIVPTIFMGMSLPIASRLAVKRVSRSGGVVGKIFSINTIGTVLGSLIAGLLIIPFFGIKTAIDFALLLNALLFLLVLFYSSNSGWKIRTSTLAILVLSSLYYVISVDNKSWAYSIMTSEISRKVNRKEVPKTFKEFMRFQSNHEEILYYKEGVSGTIVIGRQGENVYLYTNGKGDASSMGDLRTQVSLAQTPMILHPKPESVFVIGFGAGTTIGNVLTHDFVKHAKVAEISPEVIEASKHFSHVNQEPLKDKRLNVIQDDGVSALRLSKTTYDLIISQPSNPWSAGVGNLFTKEFFRDCKDKLKPGGYVAQWFNLYEIDDENLQIILKTAKSQFDYISIWQIGTSDILILCSENKFNFDLDLMLEKYQRVEDKLANVKINSFYTFLSQEFLSWKSQDLISNYIGKTELNTENLPLIEFKTPKAYFLNSTPTEFINLDERDNFENSNLILNQYLKNKEELSDLECFHLGMFQSTSGSEKFGFSLAQKNPSIYIAWGRKELSNKNYDQAINYFKDALKTDSSLIEGYKGIVNSFVKKGDRNEAFEFLQDVIKFNSTTINVELIEFRAELLMNMEKYDLAIKEYKRLLEMFPDHFKYYNSLATIYAKKRDYRKVVEQLDFSLEISEDSESYYKRGFAYGVLNEYDKAIVDFTKAINLNPDYGEAYFLRGRSYLSIGEKEKACEDWNKSKSLGISDSSKFIINNC